MAEINIGYLIPHLRLNLGDINPDAYRYVNEWLKIALLASVKTLGAWWNQKYLTNELDDTIYRNSLITFDETEPPIVIPKDERAIVLMASIIVQGGSLENNAWNLASWKDAEISYSNLESGRVRSANIQRLWEELKMILTPPSKRLAKPLKNSLPGYKGNLAERTTDL